MLVQMLRRVCKVIFSLRAMTAELFATENDRRISISLLERGKDRDGSQQRLVWRRLAHDVIICYKFLVLSSVMSWRGGHRR